MAPGTLQRKEIPWKANRVWSEISLWRANFSPPQAVLGGFLKSGGGRSNGLASSAVWRQ